MTIRPPTKSWSSTLRLPKSSFPARPLLDKQYRYLERDKQHRFLDRCTKDLYNWQRKRSSQQFVLHDGPPYANGSLHIGHALNKILKDIICRVKIQQGHSVTFVPGWDCHGLPIEIKALEQHRKKTNNDGTVLDAIGVRRAARSLAAKTVKEQMNEFREWGVMADWEKAWTTMDKCFEIKQLGVFRNMVKDGLIFRRYKPVYWSPSSKTALAEAELEYKDDHVSTAAYVRFPLTQIPDGIRSILPDGEILNAVIWTTTPWTLPANRAIAVHSELEYSVVKHGRFYILVASTRLDTLAKLFSGTPISENTNSNSFKILSSGIMGETLVGSQYTNTLRGREQEPQPIIHADFVSAESGSGLVHLAPGHGMDDYEVCTRLGIQAVAPVDDLGCFTAAAIPDKPDKFVGKSVLDGGSLDILNHLGDHILLSHKYKHKYPYDWRTKLPVIVRATEQWFADVGRVKEDALKNLRIVKFIPETGKSRLESFVKGRSEWCISRQRAWGVPIPALYDFEGGAVLTDESVAHIISAIEKRGIDAWWTDPPDDPAWIVPGLEGVYRRGKDTMDVWFDSGTSWTQTEQIADVYLEGTDQHRGWFQSSLLTHTSASDRKGKAPFKTLITHGFTLDKDGKKMSKSIGNTIAPAQIIDGSLLPATKKNQASQSLGPDALRLWVASSDYTRDVVIGHQVLQFNHSALLKYRMTIKMLLGSMHSSARTAPLTKLDQIALFQLKNVMEEVSNAYNDFEFSRGVNAINKWISTDLSAFYIDALKDRLYCGDGGGVLYEIFHGLLRMLAPITPFLVEEAWTHRPGWLSGDVLPFHQTPKDHVVHPSKMAGTAGFESAIPLLLSANAAIKAAQEEARTDKKIRSSLESRVVLELDTGDETTRETIERFADELDSIFVVSSVKLGGDLDGPWKYSATFDVPGGKATAFVLPAKDHKCPRCWRFVAPVEDSLCGRCEESVSVS